MAANDSRRRKQQHSIASDYPAQQSTGPSTDSDNRPVVDPTENVLSLVAAAIQRQDDLRVAEGRLRDADTRHLREISMMRAEHAKDLREAEADRINAIRAVDVGAVNRAAEVAAQQATTLATQVAAVADALRLQVAAAATASATSLAAALAPIQKDVSELRQVQFQQQGERVAQRDDRETRTTDRGQNNWAIGLAITIVLFIAAEVIRGGIIK